MLLKQLSMSKEFSLGAANMESAAANTPQCAEGLLDA